MWKDVDSDVPVPGLMVVLKMGLWFFLLVSKGLVSLVVYCSSMNMVVIVLRQSPLQVV